MSDSSTENLRETVVGNLQNLLKINRRSSLDMRKTLIERQHDRTAGFLINMYNLKRVFIYSMMTVLNETTNFKKYDTLKYVEFLEMLCRVAIVTSEPDSTETVEQKLFNLLDNLFDKLKALPCGDFDPDQGGIKLTLKELEKEADKAENVQKKNEVDSDEAEMIAPEKKYVSRLSRMYA